jgi:hypothetical protein
MKIAVLRVLALKLPDGCGLAIHSITDQMMPAENLVKNNAIRKTAEPHAENEASPH